MPGARRGTPRRTRAKTSRTHAPDAGKQLRGPFPVSAGIAGSWTSQRDSGQRVVLRRDVTRFGTGDRCLLLEYQRRSAYSLPFEVDYHFDAIGDLHQGDAFVHAVVLAVEGHRSFNLA